MHDDAEPRRRRVWPGVLVIVAITVAAAFIANAVLSEPSTSGTLGSVGTGITGTPTSEATAPPTTTSSAAPEPPPLPHDYVAQGMPESFTVECGGETLVSASQLTTTVRKLRVRDYATKTRYWNLGIDGDTVALVQDEQHPWAEKPGSEAGAVSIWGHADEKPKAFNPIAQFRGDPSDCEATIEVPGGTLGYGYVQTHTVTPKDQQLNKSIELSTMPDKAGKLLVSTCESAVSEVIWELRLQWSKARQ